MDSDLLVKFWVLECSGFVPGDVVLLQLNGVFPLPYRKLKRA